MTDSEQRFQVSGSAAELYERWPVRAFFEDWAQDLLERAGVDSGDDVLDIACGTGVVSRAATRRVGANGSVTGADLNEPMIEAATRLAPADTSITWRVADAEHLPFEESSFDVVLCQQGLQFVPDHERAVSEMHRVLRPAGRVAASVWRGMDENPYFVAVAVGLIEHVGPGADGFLRAACGLADADEVRSVFERAGFAEVEVEIAELLGPPMPAAELILGNLSGTPVAETLAEMTADARLAMIDTITRNLGDRIDEDGQIRVLTRTNVVSATKS